MTLFDEFRTFVKAQPLEKVYDFHDIHSCALAQFGQLKYPESRITAGNDYINVHATDEMVEVIPINHPHRDDVMNSLLWSKTFGELSTRLEEVFA